MQTSWFITQVFDNEDLVKIFLFISQIKLEICFGVVHDCGRLLGNRYVAMEPPSLIVARDGMYDFYVLK